MPRVPRCGGLGAALLFVIALPACSTPQSRVDRLARQAGLVREIVPGAPFRHVIYRPGSPHFGSVLHVYIEGDGTPYLDRNTVAADPTPRAPLALYLMRLDPSPSLYLGRPCYLGLAQDPGCDASYWTLKRFSPEVVQSMAAALEFEIARSGNRHITLIGHSGGATLAVLMADRVPEVDQVITIAGNLDVEGWARLHHYRPLSGSLDPMSSGPHRLSVELVHFAGGDDQTIPAAMITAAAARLGGRVVVIPHFDHQCCWQAVWPSLLQSSRAGLLAD
jgi:pimeloyl-ACP methyl ester carboxylesterase